MPELPDLEVFSHNLNKALAGKKVSEVEIKNARKLNTDSKELKASIEDQKLKKVYRDGKELFFEFSNGNILGLHLMLHGELHLSKEKEKYNHTIISLAFSDGHELVLTDFQGAAVVSLNPEQKKAPDALSKEMTVEYLKEVVQKSRAAIKNILLDQKIIRGIGNAYADEILWDAGISPFSPGKNIPDNKVTALAKSIRQVLTDAQEEIRKADPDIITGEIRHFLKIHNSKKKTSPTGATIKVKTATRKTYYTDEQEEF